MKKIYLALFLAIFNLANALEKLPERGLDISMGENENGSYMQIVDYNVEEQKLENIACISYETERELDSSLSPINRNLSRAGIEIGVHGVTLLSNFDPRKYMIRVPEGLSITPFTYLSDYGVSSQNTYEVLNHRAIPHTVYRSNVTMVGGALADFLLRHSPSHMRQKDKDPFYATFLQNGGEEKISLNALEDKNDLRLKRLGQICTELTLISRGYNPIISCEMDGIPYEIFKYTPPREDDSFMYFITTSVCSKKNETARKIAQDHLRSPHVLKLIDTLKDIVSLSEEMSTLRHYVRNSGSVFLFAHRTVGTGRSQSFIRTTEDLKLENLQSLETTQKLEELRRQDPKRAESMSQGIGRLEAKIASQETRWGQPLESDSEEDSDGGSGSS